MSALLALGAAGFQPHSTFVVWVRVMASVGDGDRGGLGFDFKSGRATHRGHTEKRHQPPASDNPVRPAFVALRVVV